jgi:MFS family permease
MTARDTYFELPHLVWAEIALAIGSVAPILGMPIIVGALQDGWGYSAAYAGYVTSVDLAGLFVGSVATSVFAHRMDWRWYVGAALTMSAAFNVLCAEFHSIAPLCAFRFAAGLASGATYASSLTLLSRCSEPMRAFSYLILLQVIANAVVLFVFPLLNERWGPGAIFQAIAAVLAASVAVAPLLPHRDARAVAPLSPAPLSPAPLSPTHTSSRSASRRMPGRGVPLLPALCIAAVALFYVTIGSYWAYAERMGIEFGISAQRVHWLLTAGVFLSAAACLSARAVGLRFGQSGALLGALTVLAATLLVHALLPTAAMFVINLAVLQLCWNFIDIFQLGTLAVVNPSGRAAALVPAAQGAALALGPAAAGFILGLGQGYTAVLLLAGSTTAMAAAAYAVVHRYRGDPVAALVPLEHPE